MKLANATKRWKHNNPDTYRARRALQKHKENGHIILVSSGDVITMFETTTHCPLCGVELTNTLDKSKTGKSLDRINNEEELRSDNLWVICNRCNFIKRDMTLKEFVKYCGVIDSKFRDTYKDETPEERLERIKQYIKDSKCPPTS